MVFYSQNDHVWPELNAENIEKDVIGNDQDRPGGYFLWRNVFSAINLLRVLNKLTKWKHARTMMLVVFKSAPIMKRALRVKQVLLQVNEGMIRLGLREDCSKFPLIRQTSQIQGRE